jgi:hypothetical protein
MSGETQRHSRRRWLAFAFGVGATLMRPAQPWAQRLAVEPWLIVEGETDGGKRVVGRILDREPGDDELRCMSRLLRVTVDYGGEDRGMPTETELEALRRLEDELCLALEEGQRSKLVMAEVGDGVRLWLIYVDDTVDIEAAMRKASSKSERVFMFSTLEDAGWTIHQGKRTQVERPRT